MLIGNFHHSIQAKGRIAVPTVLRISLGDKPVLTRGIEPCLYLLPFDTWKKMTANLGTNPLGTSQQRQLRRLLAHDAALAKPDNQGRISIPKPLRIWANLSKKVVIAGSLDWVEIWDLETYFSHIKKAKTQAPDLAQNISNHHE